MPVLAAMVASALVAPAAAAAVAPVFSLRFDPSAPDGTNGWYRTAPLVYMTSDQNGVAGWSWDGAADEFAMLIAGAEAQLTVAPEGDHALRAYAANAVAESQTAIVSTFRVDQIAPGQPGAFSGTVVHNAGVQLTWAASTDTGSGISGYTVYRKEGGFPGVTDWLADTTSTSYTDFTVPAFGTYYYAVAAWDTAGNRSAFTETTVGYYDWAAPAVVGTVAARQPGYARAFAVSWIHDGTDTTSYVIERAAAGGAFEAVATVATDTATWTDTLAGVAPVVAYGTPWTYRIKAVGPGGESAWAQAAPVVLAPAPTGMALHRSAYRFRVRKPLLLTGDIYGGQPGDVCVVYMRRPGTRRWAVLFWRAADTPAPWGARWVQAYVPTRRGTYRFTATFVGAPGRLPSSSGLLTLVVR